MHVVAEKWPLLFQIFPSKNRNFDFEKIEFPEKILYGRRHKEDKMSVKIMYHQNETMLTSYVDYKVFQDFIIILLRCGYCVNSVAIIDRNESAE